MENIFITIEGIDGAGKSTIVSMLAEKMLAAYIKTPAERFSDMRQRIESHGSIEEKYAFYLYSLEQQQDEIKALLEKQSVICDRYIHSTIAYQWPDTKPLPTDIHNLFPELIWPHRSILLTVNKDVARERIAWREKKTGVVTATDHNWLLLDKAHHRFLSMPDLIQIDTSEKTQEQVCDQILSELME